MRRVRVAVAVAVVCIASVAPAARCPDRNGDGACTVMLVGDEKQQPFIPRLATDLTDADTICNLTRSGISSAELRALMESVTAPGAQQNRCTSHGGTLVRGTERAADLIFIDVGTVADFVRTQYAPRTGRCWPSEDTCRVDARYGPFDAYPAGNRRCIDGPDVVADCTSTPCTGDPAPADPIASWCQANVFGASDTGVTVVNCPGGLCRQRATVAAVQQNIRRIVEVVQQSGAVPILVISYPPATWREAGDCSRTPAPVTSLPSGTPIPDPAYNAAWEVAYCDLQALAVWAHTFVCPTDTCQTVGGESWGYSAGPLGWLDLDRLVRQATGGKPWRVLGDQRLASTAPAGRCTCLVDADCGSGGSCVNNSYCGTGSAATCTTDQDCAGNSQSHPGSDWCWTDVPDLFTDGYRGCMAGDPATSTERPAWDCDAPRVPANPAWTTNTPTVTDTPLATNTPTITATATITPTAGGPTATATGTVTRTRTPYTPPTFTSSCVGASSTNPVACDKIATAYRGLRDWGTHIGTVDSNSNYGYAPGSCAEVDLGYASDPVIRRPTATYPPNTTAGIPNELRCQDVEGGPCGAGGQGPCTNDVARDFSHLGGWSKWLYQGVCSMPDAEAIWYWIGAPDQAESNALFGLPLACDVWKYYPQSAPPFVCTATSTPECQAWELSRCIYESIQKPQIEEAFALSRAYGRCSVTTSRPCSAASDCPGGESCTGNYLTNDCVAVVWNRIGKILSQEVIAQGCLTGATSCLNTYKNLYKYWDSPRMRTYCGEPGATFVLDSQDPPTCPGARGDPPANGALLDCYTYFDWVRAAIRRALPLVYGCRQQSYTPGTPAPWEPW